MHEDRRARGGGSCVRRLWPLAALAIAGCEAAPVEQPRHESDLADPMILAQAAATPAAGKAPAAPTARPPLLPCPAQVPAAIDPPAQATLALALAASGTQNYVCAAGKDGAAPSWTLEGPHALLHVGHDVVGIHFAGPSWQGLDGSLVKGAKLASADAPKPGALPWLLLSGTPSGSGTFGAITHIQRLDTSGGVAPASGCDAAHVGAKVLVPYKTGYFFYRAAAAGEKVKQCSSGAKAKSS
jgi:uncharacterized protein DUF3455